MTTNEIAIDCVVGEVVEPERKLRIGREVDVCVVGGGPGGIPAAVAAARNGAKTLLIERYGFLGGLIAYDMMETHGWFVSPHVVSCDGIAKEFYERLKSMDGVDDRWHAGYAIDSEKFKLVCDDIILEAGVSLLFHSLGVQSIVTSGSIKGIIVENKSGRQAILAKVVIDATGDGDIAYLAGAPFAIGREADGLMEPVSLNFKLSNVDKDKFESFFGTRPLTSVLRKIIDQARENNDWPINRYFGGPARITDAGEATGINITRIQRVNSTDVEDMTKAELEGRRQVRAGIEFFRKYVAGFEHCELSAIACQTGPRESRRILGSYIITEEDILNRRRFDDTVGYFCDFIDIHDPTEATTKLHMPTKGGYFHIPYRALVPLKVENLLVAGRCISATHEAVGATRQVLCCMATGQAAGTAAALAIGDNTVLSKIDVSKLQARLMEQGVKL